MTLLHLCTRNLAHGCLFDIYVDPSEEHNLAGPDGDEAQYGQLFKQLLQRMDEYQDTVYSPDRGVFFSSFESVLIVCSFSLHSITALCF